MTTAIVLAGGLGTRLRETVPDWPKPMAPVVDKPFLTYLLDYWIGQGIDHFVLSVGYRHEAILDTYGAAYRGVRLDYAIETEPLGTGGALRLAARHCPVGQGFLLLNGDTFFAVDLAALRAFAAGHQAGMCLSLFQTNDVQRYHGVDLGADGRIASLHRQTDAGPCLANGGVYWCEPDGLQLETRAKGACSLENDVFPVLFANQCRIAGLEFKAPFIDIGIPEDYHRAGEFLRRGAL
jgi:D-glycero-alpha-D-manno-heptose 1-phosphate guanylyltransferase